MASRFGDTYLDKFLEQSDLENHEETTSWILVRYLYTFTYTTNGFSLKNTGHLDQFRGKQVVT